MKNADHAIALFLRNIATIGMFDAAKSDARVFGAKGVCTYLLVWTRELLVYIHLTKKYG